MLSTHALEEAYRFAPETVHVCLPQTGIAAPENRTLLFRWHADDFFYPPSAIVAVTCAQRRS